MNAVRIFLVPFLAGVSAFAQAPARPEFEVASVKPATPAAPGQAPIGVHIDGSQVGLRYLSLQDLITISYTLKKHQVIGPDWLSTERYDIQAKFPAGLAGSQMRDQMRLMLQPLLAERFKLKFHRETRELPVYALVPAKSGAKLKETPPDPETDGAPKAINIAAGTSNGRTTVGLSNGGSITVGFLFLEGKKVNMIALVEYLGRMVDRPVIDDTGLKSNYDFRLEYNLEEMRSMMRTSGSDPNMLAGVPEQGTSVMTSLQSLGLKLEARKAPLEVFVIDRVEKTPAEN
jgi:uncharacterized protein (TIGR03435 family)